ncbi:MAG: hypothetical protein JJW01_00205 [Alphaproteobacteria bacterium]|nr:hypothetical protein [Rickettsiales bacterium]
MRSDSCIFGTDGIRGFAFGEKINPISCVKIATAFCMALEDCKKKHNKISKKNSVVTGKKSSKKALKIIIAQDSRESCMPMYNAIIAGITGYGCDVIDYGTVHIGVISASIISNSLECVDGAIMISASHNPYHDNGLKFFDSFGCKINNEIREEIVKYLNILNFGWKMPFNGIGSVKKLSVTVAVKTYLSFLKSKPLFFKINKNSFRNIKIVVDCANGATSFVANHIFGSIGIKPILINNSPNGVNINMRCGVMNPISAKQAVISNSADFGFCFDGDGDRILVIDEKGKIVEGEKFLASLSLGLKNNNKLYNLSKSIVTTIASNSCLKQYLTKNDFDVFECEVGDGFVLENMIKEGSNLGGEESGHVILKDILPVSDGFVSAVAFLRIVLNSKQTVSSIVIEPKLASYKKFNIDCLHSIDSNSKIMLNRLQEKYKLAFREKGHFDTKIIIRPSGTEKKIRIYIESENNEFLQQVAQNVKEEILKVIM